MKAILSLVNCEFGVRIVPLYPPACRKRRLKGGVHCSLVVTFAAIRLLCPRFKLRPGQKFQTRFLLHAHPCSASGTTTSGTRASPKPGNSPSASEGSIEWVSVLYCIVLHCIVLHCIVLHCISLGLQPVGVQCPPTSLLGEFPGTGSDVLGYRPCWCPSPF